MPPGGGCAFFKEAEEADALHAPYDENRDGDDGGDDQSHRVGFGNISPNFLRPDEVVDGDEVEARAEFVPEEPLGGGDEDKEAGVDDHEGEEDVSGPCFSR